MKDQKTQKHKGFLQIHNKNRKEKKEEKLALNEFRFRLVVGFFNEVGVDVTNLEQMSDPLMTVRTMINKNKGYLCVLGNKLYNLNRFLQLASRLIINDFSEHFQDIDEQALKKVQSNYGQFQKYFQEIIQQGVNTLCHVNVDDQQQRFDIDQKENNQKVKKHQLEMLEGLVELLKGTIEHLLPPDDSSKVIDSPQLIAMVKQQKVLWMKRSLDPTVFTKFAEVANDVYQALMNQVEDEQQHQVWDARVSELLTTICEFYYVFSLETVHLVTIKKQALLFLQKLKLTIQQSLLFIEKEVGDPQKTKKMEQLYLYSSAMLLAGSQVPFWSQVFSNNLHPIDSQMNDELVDEQNHMNLFYKGQQLLVEFQEPISYLKALSTLIANTQFQERKELKLNDYANGIKDFESFCQISIYFCNNILMKHPQLLSIFQQIKPTFLQKLIKQLETSPITDVQITSDPNVEKQLLSYGYKKVNKAVGGQYLYYCRGCAGPYYIIKLEIRTGPMAELLAEVNPEGSKVLMSFEKIGEDLVLYIEKALKTQYDPKKMEVVAELLAEEPGHEVYLDKDKAIDTGKGLYVFYQQYNTAKQFYEQEFTLFKDQWAHQQHFQAEQVLLLVEGNRECQLKVQDNQLGIRKVDSFKELEVYLLRQRPQDQQEQKTTDDSWKDPEQLNQKYRDTYGCTNVMVVELQQTRFGQVSIISKHQKDTLAKDNKVDLVFIKVPEDEEEHYFLLKLFVDYEAKKKSKKEFTVQDLKSVSEKVGKAGVTQVQLEERLCKSVKDKGTPFLDDDPDEYLKFYVGKEPAFPKESEEFNYAKQVEEADFDCEKQAKMLPVLKEHTFQEVELIFGNVLQNKMEGLLADLLKEAAVNKCMLGKVYEITSSCKENILYLSKIDGSNIIEEVCVGPSTPPTKLVSMPKDDLVPIEKKYYLTVGMMALEYPSTQYEFNSKFNGYIPATWLELEPILLQHPDLKKKVRLYVTLWIKTDPFNHNYLGFIDEYNNQDKCLKVNNNFLREEQVKDPAMDPILFNIKSAVANSASPLMLQQIIDQIGIAQSLLDNSRLKKLLKNNQCKFTKVYLPVFYKGKPGSSCDIIDSQFILKSLFFSAETGVQEICDGINFAIADVYYLEIIIYEDAIGDDQALDLLIAKRQGYVSIQKHRKYSLKENGYTIALRVWAKPTLQTLQMKSLICDSE